MDGISDLEKESDENINTELKNDKVAEVNVSTVKNTIAELEKNDLQDGEGCEKLDKEEKAEELKIHTSRSINVYRRIAYFFIFLVIILIGFIAYFSLIKVNIVLVPNQERISNNIIFDIHDKETEKSEIGKGVEAPDRLLGHLLRYLDGAFPLEAYFLVGTEVQYPRL